MTDITLNLTLKELQQIDKFVEINDDTLSVLTKIKDAYPSQKSPVEEAYKDWWGEYPPTTPSVDNYEDTRWRAFQMGYNASQEPKKEQKWDVVRESVKWCEEHPDESVEEYLKPHTPEKTEQLLREAFQKVQQTEEWKETQRKIDGNYDELVESETSPPEPTSTVFRQKLFDGIKSVFYDPDYERTHWKMKVDMAVDEVMTHFYDILPEPEEYIGDYGPSQGYVDGWNHYHKIIKEKLE
jgi:hypothetical protein